ncbi:MAG: asparagine synthase (glutamine-hydrolyzing) [bacterium]|nr:asparagine synthase (glutamine-hydrolyzing) [bacterium]
MCGVAGFNFKDDELAKSMGDAIAHRGPDDQGSFADEIMTLVHRRLSIIDLSAAGHQPMISDDGNLVIIYNGEIYNFNDIRKTLIAKGYQFSSRTDTEVILRGYEAYGEDIFNKLRGMWALAIYDKKRQKLLLSRDFFGVKPLYYYHNGNDFVFASETKAIIKFLEERKISLHGSPMGLMSYFTLGYAPQPLTISQEIKKVASAEVLILDLASKQLTSRLLFWPNSNKPSNADDFEKVMLESVERHLMADVPVGVFLSGGADSTLIAVLLKKLGQKLKAFTVNIPGRQDAVFADKIAKFTGLDQQEIVLNDDNFEEMYQKLWESLDEPVADTSLIPSLLVSREAAKSVKVVMTGEGGDELFWGYPRHQNLVGASNILSPNKFIEQLDNHRQPASQTYLNYLRPLLRRWRYYDMKRRGDLVGLYLELTNLTSDFASRSQLQNYFCGRLTNTKPDVSLLDKMFYLPDDLLYKNDFATMNYGIEGRVPILDREAYSFANNLDPHFKIENAIGKKIVKDYLSANLPPELIFRSKEGFSVPLQQFLFRLHKQDIKDSISYLLDCRVNFIDRLALAKMLKDENYFNLISRKFPALLFVILTFYKVTKKYRWANL